MAILEEPKSSGEATIVTGKEMRGVGEFTGEIPREIVIVGRPITEAGIDTELLPEFSDPPYHQLSPKEVPEKTVGLKGVIPGAGGVSAQDTTRGGKQGNGGESEKIAGY